MFPGFKEIIFPFLVHFKIKVCFLKSFFYLFFNTHITIETFWVRPKLHIDRDSWESRQSISKQRAHCGKEQNINKRCLTFSAIKERNGSRKIEK